jgi:hypothetical protein
VSIVIETSENSVIITSSPAQTVEVLATQTRIVEVAAVGPQGPQGPQGIQGPQGDSWQEYFETVSKNLKSWDASFNYSGGNLTSIVYTDGVDTITKTFNYIGDSLTSIVLGGDTSGGIELTKTLGYTSGNLTSVTYS